MTFLIITMASFMIAAMVAALIMKCGSSSPTTMRLATIAQDLLMLIVPAIVAACLVSRYPADLLSISRMPTLVPSLLGVAVLFVSAPAMNYLVDWNESITLPASIKAIEQWMRQSEDAADAAVKLMLGDDGIPALIVNVLIVGVLAGFSEELFFRGALLRLLSRNHHVAIWLTAALFSAIHIQFYGFVPRLLLGAFFGYALLWSGSLILPMLLHAINNTTVVVMIWRGYDSGTSLLESSNPVIIVTSLLLTVILITLMHKNRRRC